MARSASRLVVALALLALPPLLACTSPAGRKAAAEAQAAADRQECQDLGFRPGTEAFADCLLRLRQLRAAEGRAAGPRVGIGVGFGFSL